MCGTARLSGQVCPREVWLRVQTVSCYDGRFDPAQNLDLSERKQVCVPHMVLPTDRGYLALALHVEG